MPPSTSSLGEAAQSAPLSSSSLSISVIIIVSSAAGTSALLFFIIIAVTLHRRVRARRLTKTRTETVPRVVITDTSQFPASNVFVEGGAALDQVIASFNPRATLSPIMEEVATVNDSRIDLSYGDEDEDQLFPLPKILKPKSKLMTIPQQTYLPHRRGKDNRPDISATHRHNRRWTCNAINFPDQTDDIETSAGIWWHDFQTEESLDSTSSLSEGDKSVSSVSIYSTDSNHGVPALLKVLEPSPGTVQPNMSEGFTTTSRKTESGEMTRGHITGDTADGGQNTTYDKDILAYCWRLSGENHESPFPSGMAGADDRRMTRYPHGEEVAGRDTIAKVVASLSKASSLRSHTTSDAFDQRILEYCWRISDNSSVKSISDLSGSESVTVRFTTAARSVSSASVSGPGALPLHDSGQLVLSQKTPLPKEGRNPGCLRKQSDPAGELNAQTKLKGRMKPNKKYSLQSANGILGRVRASPLSDITRASRVNKI